MQTWKVAQIKKSLNNIKTYLAESIWQELNFAASLNNRLLLLESRTESVGQL